MDVRDIRLANLRARIDTEPGPDRGRQARFARRIGKAPAQVSQWLGGYRTLDDESARQIEVKLGMPRWALDTLTAAEAPAPYLAGPQAHPVSYPAFDTPPSLKWEDVMQKNELPQQFIVALPDGALAGQYEAGARIVFDRTAPPKVGRPVLVQDREEARWVRLYGNVRGPRWQALATAPGHITLDSEADGLVLLAAARWVEL